MNFLQALFLISWEALKGGAWQDRLMVLCFWGPLLAQGLMGLYALPADAAIKLHQLTEFLSTFTQPLSI